MNAVVDLIHFHAQLQANSLAVTELESNRCWTYAEFDLAVAKCASVLLQNDICFGDRLVVLAKNCAEVVMLYFACTRIGAIFVPLNWRLSSAEIASLVDDIDPALCIGDRLLRELDLSGISIEELSARMENAAPLVARPISGELPSLILYTSGSSGKPKGVVHSENSIRSTSINSLLFCQTTAKSVYLCDAPMFHVIGLMVNVHQVIMCGASVLISNGFNAERSYARLSDPLLGVTHYFCVPQMAQALRAVDNFEPKKLKGLRGLFTGGAPNPASHIRTWLGEGVSAVDGYGMSEAGTVFGMPLDKELIAENVGAVGIPAANIEVKIIRPDGRECELDEPGELLLRGPNISSGYWRQPEETQKAFLQDGWFRTGDMLQVNDNGFYFLVDRLKDMFISGGENVYPVEIESTLAAHPHLKESSVIGVADERWGEVGHLFVVLEEKENHLDREELLTWLEKRIAKYKLPKHISVIDVLPRNGAGKVDKNELKKNTR